MPAILPEASIRNVVGEITCSKLPLDFKHVEVYSLLHIESNAYFMDDLVFFFDEINT